MTDDLGQSENPVSDEMAEYLQVFLDETEEQLDGLVAMLLILEREPHRVDELNESFRLIHTIKGSAGMMGFDNIALLTHHLETRFEAFRSGLKTIDRPTMSLVLRCIDFLRECARRLRGGEPLGSAAELLGALAEAEQDDPAVVADAPVESPPDVPTDGNFVSELATALAADASIPDPAIHDDDALSITVIFEPDLPIVDLKARLIVTRLSALGEIASMSPAAQALDGIEKLERIDVVLITDEDPERIRAAVDVDGVRRIDVGGGAATDPDDDTEAPAAPDEVVFALGRESRPMQEAESDEMVDETVEETAEDVETAAPEPVTAAAESIEASPAAEPQVAHPAGEGGRDRTRPKVAETVRVDVNRLDRLMNLAGELVVNRARFVQVTGQVGGSFRARNVVGRMRDFGETLRSTIEQLEDSPETNGEWTSRLEELKAGLVFLEEQSERWDSDRKRFVQIGEAIDQLTRIADSLQHGVLATRMVPVAPLFNRFNRVVRDMSIECGKDVRLEIHGENTELDKRMIDELGDPLVHLVRNSIDHGLETPALRRERGKPETGTIRLEASHAGNSVYISIRDDGGGIDVARVREKIIERGLLSAAGAEELSDPEVLEYIWEAGFSTAAAVTDISGRGVGMDVVRTRILDLNGTVEINSTPDVGTTFTIRLPLTLAIINSLLVGIRNTVFSIPIDDVREIVSVPVADIVTLRGRQAVDVRGEYIPLVGVDELFDWHERADAARNENENENENGNGNGEARRDDATRNGTMVAAVVLQTGDRTMGLRVEELLGSQDIVIKSLSENFVDIRGLSGASILGDGAVCLMLDVPTLIDLAVTRSRTPVVPKELGRA